MCGNVDIGFASPYVLAGVRWNDDPPFQLQSGEAANTVCKTTETIRFTTQPRCWYQLFRDAETQAGRGRRLDASGKASLLARSHFGDLSFLHAMAAQDGERAGDTQARIMMWAEFTWKVSRGDYGLETRLKDVDVAGFGQFFGRYEWRVQDLFALGNPVLRQRIKEVAFGSVLHMVEDSFAKGHTDRVGFGARCAAVPDRGAPGPIREMHSYIHQDASKHGFSDSRDAFVVHLMAATPSVVDVGMALRAYQEQNSGPAAWDEVRPYVACIFSVEDPNTLASAGADFKRAP